jgi:phospholipid transport system transporter-binding protein
VSQASITERAPGQLQLAGVLDYSTGPLLREQGARLIAASRMTRLALDCSAVEKSSSVGLALLLAFTRDAHKAGRELSISALPEDMRQIAQVSGLLDVLPLESPQERRE